MAQQAKCLLCKSKDLNLDPQYPFKAGSSSTPLFILSIGGVETGGSQEQELAGQQSSRNGVLQLQWETLCQKARWKVVEENSRSRPLVPT